jgi:plasmid stabilization system protein ParE
MNYTIFIEELAEKDIDEAFLWYEMQKAGLGYKFIDIIKDHVNSIKDNPYKNTLYHKNLRRIVIKRFPFNIFYYIINSKIFIMAILHTKRNPKIILKRTKS